MIVAPSIMCADLLNIENDLRMIEKAGAEWIHIDIMDGHFVPGFTFGADFVKAMKGKTNLKLDVHLMSDNSLSQMESLLAIGIDHLTVHVEPSHDIFREIYTIKEAGVKAGIALNPGTPLSSISEIIDMLDQVIIMTVTPGFVGNKLIKESLNKAKNLVNLLLENGKHHVNVVIDGGVKVYNIEEIASTGVNVVVSGTGIFRHSNPPEAIHVMKKARQGITSGL